MAIFEHINSQGSVSTHVNYGGTFI